MKTDHKAAKELCDYDNLTPSEWRTVKAAYLELLELAKAFYNDPSHGTPTAYALRAAIGEK